MQKVFTGAYKEQHPSRQKGKKKSGKLGFLKDLSELIHPFPFHSIPEFIQPLPWGLQKQRIKVGAWPTSLHIRGMGHDKGQGAGTKNSGAEEKLGESSKWIPPCTLRSPKAACIPNKMKDHRTANQGSANLSYEQFKGKSL